MTVRRTWFQIFVEIMENCRKPLAYTRLMNTVGIQWTLFKKYSCFLEELGFIKRVEPPPVRHKQGRKERRVKFHYQIDSKGVEALRLVKEAYLLSELFSYRQWLEYREGET